MKFWDVMWGRLSGVILFMCKILVIIVVEYGILILFVIIGSCVLFVICIIFDVILFWIFG